MLREKKIIIKFPSGAEQKKEEKKKSYYFPCGHENDEQSRHFGGIEFVLVVLVKIKKSIVCWRSRYTEEEKQQRQQ